MKFFLVCASLLFLAALVVAKPKPASSVKDVRTVFDGGASGNAFFNARLRSEMRGMGIRFVSTRKSADAILRSGGQSTDEGGFSGWSTLASPSGNTLWSAKIERAPASRVMAFDSLAQKLRAARR